ncbi:MAG: YceI family protein [Cyclobacteriaceae bacterium]
MASESSDLFFSVTHLGFLTVNGSFSTFSGECVFNGDTFHRIDGQIQVNSINTNDETRDESLRSDAYLNEQAYPLITFRSTQIVSSGKTPILIGKLKLKDQEHEIRMPVSFRLSEATDSCLITISTTIRRSQFHLDFGPMDALVGDEVRIDLAIVATRAPKK